MTGSLEDLLRDTLAARAHDVDGVDLTAAPPAARGHRRWVAIGTVAAVAAVVLVAVVLIAPWRSTPQGNGTPATVPSPPAGMQWVSFHGITLTVPATWAVGGVDCSMPATPGVIFVGTSALQCRPLPRDGQAFVRLNALGTTPPEGTATTVAGHPAYRDTRSGAGPDQTATFQLRDAGVAMDVTLPVDGATSMNEILDAVEYTPVDHYGCTAQRSTRTGFAAPLDLTNARSVRVCEYAPRGDGPTPPWLVGSRLLSAAEVDQLGRTLATTEVVVRSPSGTVGLGSFVAVGSETSGDLVYRFELPDGTTEAVTVEAGSRPVYVYGGGSIGKLAGTDGDGPVDLPNAYP